MNFAAITVGFEQENYTVAETLGAEYGLLVCVTVEDVPFSFYLITTTQDGTAQGMLSAYRTIDECCSVLYVTSGFGQVSIV